jgi:hypothetical protein
MSVKAALNVTTETGETRFEYDMESLKMTPEDQKKYLEHEVIHALVIDEGHRRQKLS